MSGIGTDIRQWLIYRDGEYLSDFGGTRREAEQFAAREYGAGCVLYSHPAQ